MDSRKVYSTLLGGSCEPMNVIVVGHGFIGRLHVNAWCNIPGATVVGVVDPFLDQNTKHELARRKIQWFGDLEKAIDSCPKVDCISVCTPPSYHKEAVLVGLSKGIAVILEKPVCTTMEDYQIMKKAVEEYHGKVMVGLTHRFYPEVVQAREWIRQGVIGRVISLHEVSIFNNEGLPQWYKNKDVSGGGVLITNGVHFLDRIHFVSGLELQSLYHVKLFRDNSNVENIASLAGALEGNISFTLHVEWSSATSENVLTIYGTRGRIEVYTWRHAVLHRLDGSESVCPYPIDSTFEERTAMGLSAEIQLFVNTLDKEIPPELTLHGHEKIMCTIWDCYSRHGIYEPIG